MTFFKTVLFVAALSAPSMSSALDLDSARKKNVVKELPTGYIIAVDSGDPKVQALVNEVNTKRKKHYEKVAKKNGTKIEVVSKTAAEKIKEKLGK